ncbi:hypothetical protein [Mesorhizobium sp. M0323]|uniref:hypothetical protein n=1 Tax=Mesorhizobium sp. M0323 TaxID=2956938 RepID=UPI003335E1F3
MAGFVIQDRYASYSSRKPSPIMQRLKRRPYGGRPTLSKIKIDGTMICNDILSKAAHVRTVTAKRLLANNQRTEDEVNATDLIEKETT